MGGYLWLKHSKPMVQPVVQPSAAAAKPKREEIDMMALRSYCADGAARRTEGWRCAATALGGDAIGGQSRYPSSGAAWSSG
jgi:hypothetical protein